MTRKITAAEIAAWRARWRLVEERQAEELRRQSVEQKFRELAGLMAAAERFGWEGRSEEERALVRRRWLQIYRAHGFGKEDS